MTATWDEASFWEASTLNGETRSLAEDTEHGETKAVT